MTKKEYLIKILQLLEKKRSTARGLLELIKRSDVNDTIFDHILNIINREIDTLNQTIWSKNISKTVNIIQNIKNKENIDKQQTELELAELEKELNYI